MRRILTQVRRLQSLPSQANLAKTFPSDKKKGILDCSGLRWINCFCGLWSCLLRGLMRYDAWPFNAPHYAYGGVRARRREEPIAAMKMNASKLNRAGIIFAPKSYDAKSAFHSGLHSDIIAMTDHRLNKVTEEVSNCRVASNSQIIIGHRKMTCMETDLTDGTALYRFAMGGAMGDANEYEDFMGNYHQAVDAYLRRTPEDTKK